MNQIIDGLTNSLENETIMTLLGGGIIILSLILGVILIISYIKALKKAKKSAINVLWNFIPLIGNIVLAFILKPTENFGKGKGYLIGLILLPIIFVPILAFSDMETIKTETINEDNKNIESANNIASDTESFSSNVVEEPIVGEQQILENNSINEPVIETSLNPINREQITETDTNTSNIEEIQSIPNDEPINIDTNNVIENIIPETSMSQDNTSELQEVPVIKTNENLENNNEPLTETKKVCKTCGNELPNIVSICPNCGTDNE